MPRLFTGIKIPNYIAQLLAFKRGKIKGARWMDMEDYHVTLRFIGDVDPENAQEISVLLGQINRDKFNICLDGMDIFGSKKPRTLFATIGSNEPLWALQREHENLIQRIGLKPEPRKYAPHVTLARLSAARREDVAQFLGQQGEFLPLEFQVESFALFSARGSIGGGPYLVEERYGLY